MKRTFMGVVIVTALVGVSYVAKVTGPDPFAMTRLGFETTVEGVKDVAQTSKGVLERLASQTEEYKNSQERLAGNKAGQQVNVVVNIDGKQADGIKASAEVVSQTTSGTSDAKAL